MPIWQARPPSGASISTRRSAWAHLMWPQRRISALSDGQTASSSGSAIAHDSFPFKTSISMLISLLTFRVPDAVQRLFAPRRGAGTHERSVDPGLAAHHAGAVVASLPSCRGDLDGLGGELAALRPGRIRVGAGRMDRDKGATAICQIAVFKPDGT